MRSAIFILNLLLIPCLTSHCNSETLTEKDAIKRYGAPSVTRVIEGQNWLYYLGQKGHPDFVLRIKDNLVIDQSWSFIKRPLIASGTTVFLRIVRPEDVISANGDINLWFNEMEWSKPWKAFDPKSRGIILDTVEKAASAFGAKSVSLSIDHPFILLITNGHPENFETLAEKSNIKRVEILSLIKRFRKRLIEDR